MVGEIGLEPTTPWASTKCSTNWATLPRLRNKKTVPLRNSFKRHLKIYDYISTPVPTFIKDLKLSLVFSMIFRLKGVENWAWLSSHEYVFSGCVVKLLKL